MTEIDLKSSSWIVPFLRGVVEALDAAATPRAWRDADGPDACPSADGPDACPSADGPDAWRDADGPDAGCFERWRAESMSRRGLLAGRPAPRWPAPAAPLRGREKERWDFLNLLCHHVELLVELRALLGRPAPRLSLYFDLLQALAIHAEADDAAEALYELSLEEWGDDDDEARRAQLARALRRPASALGQALLDGDLVPHDQPLSGLPFHQVLIASKTSQLLEVAHQLYRDPVRPDPSAFSPILTRGVIERVHLIEAIIALTQVDGVISRVERRLVDAVIKLARLPAAEAKRLRRALKARVCVDDLGAHITDPLTRRFLFKQLVIHSLLEDQQDAGEAAFLERLSVALELSPEQRLRYQTEACLFLGEHPELLSAFNTRGLLRRLGAQLDRKLEVLVKDNLARLLTEVQETAQLARLLARRARVPLSAEEEVQVRAQLIDVCKSIPALAFFALPGGSVLLPILLRLLPFNLLPTAFTDDDEPL